jgi:hypothetical protein
MRFRLIPAWVCTEQLELDELDDKLDFFRSVFFELFLDMSSIDSLSFVKGFLAGLLTICDFTQTAI